MPAKSQLEILRQKAELAKGLCENVGDENNWFFGPLKRQAQDLAGGGMVLYHGSQKTTDPVREWSNNRFKEEQLGLHLSTRMDTAITFAGSKNGFIYCFGVRGMRPLEIRDDLGLWHTSKWVDKKPRLLQRLGWDDSIRISPSFFLQRGHNAIGYYNQREEPVGAKCYIILDTAIVKPVMIIDLSKPDDECVVFSSKG